MNRSQHKITIAVLALAAPAAGQNVFHVDDHAPNDPGPGGHLISLPPHLPSTESLPRSVALADFDGDEDLDAFIPRSTI